MDTFLSVAFHCYDSKNTYVRKEDAESFINDSSNLMKCPQGASECLMYDTKNSLIFRCGTPRVRSTFTGCFPTDHGETCVCDQDKCNPNNTSKLKCYGFESYNAPKTIEIRCPLGFNHCARTIKRSE